MPIIDGTSDIPELPVPTPPSPTPDQPTDPSQWPWPFNLLQNFLKGAFSWIADIIKYWIDKLGGDMEKIIELILEALNDERYKARTIAGVAKVVKISPSEVVKKLNTIPELNRQVKIYPRRAQDGKVLITTRERFVK